MDKARFDEVFAASVAGPLGEIGFAARGKSLVLMNELNSVALIRVGGRMASPGCASHTLCFRHSFLRDRSEAVPKTAPLEPFDYPFKFRPSDLSVHSEWRYQPQNLNYPFDLVEWAEMDEQDFDRWSRDFTALIVDRVASWAQCMTPAAARDQLRKFGENAWCERLWLADYDRALSGGSA